MALVPHAELIAAMHAGGFDTRTLGATGLAQVTELGKVLDAMTFYRIPPGRSDAGSSGSSSCSSGSSSAGGLSDATPGGADMVAYRYPSVLVRADGEKQVSGLLGYRLSSAAPTLFHPSTREWQALIRGVLRASKSPLGRVPISQVVEAIKKSDPALEVWTNLNGRSFGKALLPVNEARRAKQKPEYVTKKISGYGHIVGYELRDGDGDEEGTAERKHKRRRKGPGGDDADS